MSQAAMLLGIMLSSGLSTFACLKLREEWKTIQTEGDAAGKWNQKANESHVITQETRIMYRRFALGHWQSAQNEFVSLLITLVLLMVFVAIWIFCMRSYSARPIWGG